ncbi:MAG: hypothetical protein DCF29_24625 [Alphaproteobacteria bacterium]|nr:MAG: hypothetical protein DCF29_24625 [Alphaproteobacteria bacterium]
MTRLFRQVALAISMGVVALLSAPANTLAAPVTIPVQWTFGSTQMSTGSGPATMSGSFVYDPVQGKITAFNIAQTGANPGSYTFVGGLFASRQSWAIAQRSSTASVGDPIFLVDTNVPNIYLAGSTYTYVYVGTCSHVTAGKCDDGSLTDYRNVTITGVNAPATPSIPTLGEWAMILFGAVLAGAAALYVQRRRLSV